MPKRAFLVASGLTILVLAGWLGTRRAGAAPPLVPFLDPVRGIWTVARAARPLGSGSIRLGGLERPVDVVMDSRGVPHVYAETELDLYRTLGYLVARDRLFQLEVATRASEGTLTELLGPSALAIDRAARKYGFGRLVERRAATADRQSIAHRSIEAYAEGIDAWIDGMRAEELPIEYRLLGRTPRRWRPTDTYYLLARMALMLASNDASIEKARAAALVGSAAADALFPVDAPIQEPIQPNPVDQPRLAFRPLPPPGPADSSALTLATASLASGVGRRDPDEILGSNNWAVAPSRSATGHALLAGDPHLELTLPSIWYQAHLVVPGKLDVAGVTLPGTPWVIIGFNRDVAWSFTNTGSDVNDFYRETVDDSTAPRRYRLDGEWKDLEQRIEVYRKPDGSVLAVDTSRFTHRGPLWKVGREWLSMAWTVYDDPDTSPEFAAVPAARSADEFLAAMAEYGSPAQNMIVADRQGTIAIRSTGHYPIRPGDGRGDGIRDGSASASDWIGSVPLSEYPGARNPSRGYLSSANQQPVDPQVNPRFLGASWYSPWRAIRINRALRADSAVTVDAMRRLQTDPTSVRADYFVPFLLGARTDSGRVGQAPQAVKDARRLLAEWDHRYDRNSRRAVLFELAMTELTRLTWDELAADSGSSGDDRPLRPADQVLLGLMQDSTSAWWDRVATKDRVERRDDVIELALTNALATAQAKYGDPAGEGWRWGRVHTVNIRHLLRLPALSALGLETDGGPATLSPSSGAGTDGPSWRMVVELGGEVAAWGVFPGGQSGNPASRHYLDLLPGWVAGRLDSLPTPKDPTGFPAGGIEARLRFTGKR